MTAPTARVSGADIVVPSSAPASPPAPPLPAARSAIDVVLDRIQAMLDGCGTTDRNALLTIAIEALIDAGVDTGQRIVGAAVSLGFPRKHVGVMLGKGRGWLQGSDRRYRLTAA